MINERRMLDEFLELVKITSPTRNERELAVLIKERLLKIGLDVTEDNTGEKIGGTCGNITGVLKGTAPDAPRLLLSAHLDCVAPCEDVKPVIKDGIISSAGDTVLGADDKAGLAAILEGLRVIREENIPHGDIQVIFTVAEEGGLNGSKNIDQSLIKADFGYVLDSSGAPGEIVVKAPGQNKLHIKIYGKKAHAGIAPEEGVNAIIIAGKALALLKDGRIDFETTANIGIIQGGSATNVVPDQVTIIGESRSHNPQKLREQTDHMQRTFEDIAAANHAKAEVTVEKSYDSFSLDENSKVISIAKKASLAIGLQPVAASTGGGSDANFFNKYGLPVAVLGIGMSKVHTTSEYITEKDLYNSGRLVAAIIKETAGCRQ